MYAVIPEDFVIGQEIFELIDQGIVDGYDAFSYDCKVGAGFIHTELTVELDGITSSSVREEIDGLGMISAATRLQKNAQRRGEGWTSFVMSYRRGGNVAVKYVRDDAFLSAP